MRFEDALVELRKGKKVRIKQWCEDCYLHNKEECIFSGVNSEEILSDNWEVVEEPGKTFPEVFEAFKEGKKLMRKKWKIEGDEDYLHICTARIIHVNDLLATDWMIME